jgi:hypothetical protein
MRWIRSSERGRRQEGKTSPARARLSGCSCSLYGRLDGRMRSHHKGRVGRRQEKEAVRGVCHRSSSSTPIFIGGVRKDRHGSCARLLGDHSSFCAFITTSSIDTASARRVMGPHRILPSLGRLGHPVSHRLASCVQRCRRRADAARVSHRRVSGHCAVDRAQRAGICYTRSRPPSMPYPPSPLRTQDHRIV